ncbi:tRNA uridine-5-carboxymethylaminomethyl(34) synthesis GTPase MnmE [Microvirga tunisiensis]|uniref:tRNA modification GTPase MnmE n=1 Tax=Pannonibacter tanglangensis TaxID=2750084 RepID=A0A7X5F5L3_9HYPH|nr:tRNA uridine-5-carboxymethylaminomethyl(34) synthesis GTPase MnmE [Pannonibacter sp. XCT-53]NBN80183.1 tRNA uridine-5-carboxymethylaminomethyl(34) synthesis GTPase MnmE [Pannonibacter sp. XCT-53]
MTDTIYALSSGSLPSGVAVIRLSGPAALAAAGQLTGRSLPPRKATLCRLRHPATGDVLDQALVLCFPAPQSFTGEDVVELQCHGGRAVVAAVLGALAALPGLRPAEAGEFTRRAFDRGRMDLTEVEGLADLIAAETEAQRRQAVRQMEGALGRLYEGWRKRLVHMRAMIEADFDFADEDDVPGSVADEVWIEAARLRDEVADHVAAAPRGERLRDGLQVVLMGAPNAGKSSLLNAMAGRDVAIVTEEAGTTRDVLEVHLDLGGYPVTLADTAGLRTGAGRVEQEGIRRATERGRRADLVLWLQEPGGVAPEDPASGLPEVVRIESVPVWLVRTKTDLETHPKQDSSETAQDFPVSVATGVGLAALLEALARFAGDTFGRGEALVATRERHRHHLQSCLAGLDRALQLSHLPAELRAEELRSAGDSLGRITGRIDVEDLLDVIFREFCIGK